jgi:hypothetical protein
MHKRYNLLLTIILMFGWIPAQVKTVQGQILIGPKAPPLEQYAARELQRYMYQLSGEWLEITGPQTKSMASPRFILGQAETNPAIDDLVAGGQLRLAAGNPGPQGYVLKTLAIRTNAALVIGGSDSEGVLYGVYSLLEDYFNVRFYLSGDVLPERKILLRLPQIDERKTPRRSDSWVPALDEFPAIGHRVFMGRLAVHHRPDGQNADELSAHPQL